MLFIFASTSITYAQDSISKAKAITLADAFTKGKVDVFARVVFMNTINEGLLKDDYAFAAGVGVGFTTKSFHGFRAGISSFVINNICPYIHLFLNYII